MKIEKQKLSYKITNVMKNKGTRRIHENWRYS